MTDNRSELDKKLDRLATKNDYLIASVVSVAVSIMGIVFILMVLS